MRSFAEAALYNVHHRFQAELKSQQSAASQSASFPTETSSASVHTETFSAQPMPPQSDSHSSSMHSAMPHIACAPAQHFSSSAANASHVDLSGTQPGLGDHAHAGESAVSSDMQSAVQQTFAAPDTPRTARLKDMAAQADRLMQVRLPAVDCHAFGSCLHACMLDTCWLDVHACNLVHVTQA